MPRAETSTALTTSTAPAVDNTSGTATTLPTAVPQLRVARLASNAGRVDELLVWLVTPDQSGAALADAAVRARLRAVVAEYASAPAPDSVH